MTKEINFSSKQLKKISETGKNFLSQLLERNPYNRISAKNALKQQWVTGSRGRNSRNSF